MDEQYTVRGVTKSFLEWCKELNCRPEVIRSRMSMGSSFEDTLLASDTHRDLIFRLDGEERTLQHWCRIYQINHATVRSRMKAGWDFPRAIYTPILIRSKKKKFYEINGEMKSIEELSAEYGVNQTTIQKRIGKGETAPEAVGLNYKERKSTVQSHKLTSEYRLYTINGETKPLHSWCKVYNVSINQVRYRLKNGYSLLDALKPGKNTGAFTYHYQGKKMTLVELEEISGVPRHTLYTRLEYEGLSVEEALFIEHPKPEKLFFTIDGERLSLREIGEKYGIKPLSLYSRVAVQGLSIQEAIEKPVLNQEVLYDFHGEKLNLKQISERCDISYTGLRYRVLEKNIPVEEAVIMEEPKTYCLDGEWLTIEQLSAKSGISRRSIQGRLKKGFSVKQAITKNLSPVTAARYNIFGEMLSIAEIEEKYKINQAAFRYRLSTGMTPEEAATKKHILTFNANGKDMRLSEISKLTGIKKCTLHRRLVNQGMSVMEALSTEDYRKTKKK